MTATAIIDKLGLAPHPEGGWYRQTWVEGSAGRPQCSAILFLLQAGEVSHWHRVDAAEIWMWHAGAPLVLSTSASDAGPAQARVLGPDVMSGQMPQLLVEPQHWQAARSTGDYTLVSCIVSPAFRFEGFVLAPPGFDIPLA
ncbi:MAG: cupin domain-containing protein [Gemmobacter sp.]|nr:cupin domain-containing protein [Gemmobacter sp.]